MEIETLAEVHMASPPRQASSKNTIRRGEEVLTRIIIRTHIPVPSGRGLTGPRRLSVTVPVAAVAPAVAALVPVT